MVFWLVRRGLIEVTVGPLAVGARGVHSPVDESNGVIVLVVNSLS